MRFIQDQDFRNINRLEKKKKKDRNKEKSCAFLFFYGSPFPPGNKVKMLE